MSSQLSAQAITAQTAITRMSISRWSHRRVSRGSSSPVKHAAKAAIMPLVPRCAERETANTIVNPQSPQLMREPCPQGELVAQAPEHHERDDVAGILGPVQPAAGTFIELLAAGAAAEAAIALG